MTLQNIKNSIYTLNEHNFWRCYFIRLNKGWCMEFKPTSKRDSILLDKTDKEYSLRVCIPGSRNRFVPSPILLFSKVDDLIKSAYSIIQDWNEP